MNTVINESNIKGCQKSETINFGSEEFKGICNFGYIY